MATRFSATAAAIGLAGAVLSGVLSASSAGAADAAARAVPSHSSSLSLHAEAGTVGFPVPAALVRTAYVPSAAKHATPKNHQTRQPFHVTGKKARSLPDTGVPMSAALGAVTALTALLAGIGTVLAARRRTDHEA